MTTKLKLKNIYKHFGGHIILNNISPTILSNSITALIGPNGAGKSTLFNIITGYVSPDSNKSKIIYNDIDITSKSPEFIANCGIGRLFQDLKIFKNLSVIENIEIAIQSNKDENLINIFKKQKNYKDKSEKILKSVNLENKILPIKSIKPLFKKLSKNTIEKYEYILEKIGIIENRYELAGNLSYGQQKLLAIARLIAGDFDLLLLDEPTSGINPKTIDKIMDILSNLKKEGKTIIIVEHNMQTVKDIADWVHFLTNGSIAFSGIPDHVLGAKEVRKIYLGIPENENE